MRPMLLAEIDLGPDPLGLRAEIRDGLIAGEFQVALQPIVCAASGRVKGYETLARWDRGPGIDGRPSVAPDIFIAEAEASGLIHVLGGTILAQALEAMKTLDRSAGLFVSVNVSPAQLEDPAFPGRVGRLLAATGFPPHRLELEVTEGLPVGPLGRMALDILRAMQIRVALDDFGAGFADETALRTLPIDKVKLDQSLVAPLDDADPAVAAAALARLDAVVALAASRGLKVTAEGVETEAQAAILRNRGIPLLQGWLTGRPELAARMLAAAQAA